VRPPADATLRAGAATTALVAGLVGLHLSATVTAPVAFALVIPALAWPLEVRVPRHLPGVLALRLTLAVCIAVAALLLGSSGRGRARAAHWLVENLDRFEALDERLGGELGGGGSTRAGCSRRASIRRASCASPASSAAGCAIWRASPS
jgi:predicted PurR-regulated permease PerM